MNLFAAVLRARPSRRSCTPAGTRRAEHPHHRPDPRQRQPPDHPAARPLRRRRVVVLVALPRVLVDRRHRRQRGLLRPVLAVRVEQRVIRLPRHRHARPRPGPEHQQHVAPHHLRPHRLGERRPVIPRPARRSPAAAPSARPRRPHQAAAGRGPRARRRHRRRRGDWRHRRDADRRHRRRRPASPGAASTDTSEAHPAGRGPPAAGSPARLAGPLPPGCCSFRQLGRSLGEITTEGGNASDSPQCTWARSADAEHVPAGALHVARRRRIAPRGRLVRRRAPPPPARAASPGCP
jgi:hypothetical protein